MNEDPADTPKETRAERWLERWVARAVTPRGAAVVIASATIAITIAAGAVMTVLDRENYPTIGSGLWWAVQTTTTVGYGDNVPTTYAGRLLAALVMLFGIGFLTIITAAITSTFVSRSRLEPSDTDAETSIAEQLRQINARLERIETRQNASARSDGAAARTRIEGTRAAAPSIRSKEGQEATDALKPCQRAVRA